MNKSRLSLIVSVTLVVMLTTRCGGDATPKHTSQSVIAPTSSLSSPASAATQTKPNPPPPGELLPTPTFQPFPDEKLPLLFASYVLEPISASPVLQQEAIDPQMGNVLVPLALSAEQLERLGMHGVVASPVDYPEFHFLPTRPSFATCRSLSPAMHSCMPST